MSILFDFTRLRCFNKLSKQTFGSFKDILEDNPMEKTDLASAYRKLQSPNRKTHDRALKTIQASKKNKKNK